MALLNNTSTSSDRRSARGAFSAITAMLAFMVIVPLGMLAFELQRVQLAQKQLRVTSDAAALAGAVAYNNSAAGNSAGKLVDAESMALKFVSMNNAIGSPFGTVTSASTVSGTNPAATNVVVAVSFDSVNQDVVVNMNYGYTPAFGYLLGIGTMPLQVNSKAGLGGGSQSDIVIIFDISGSMYQDAGNQPMVSAEAAMVNFVNSLNSTNDSIHLGLVTFGTNVSGHSPDGKSLTIVPLSSTYGNNNFSIISATFSSLLPSAGSTNTAGAISEATAMITGSGHRQNAAAYILLITDGLPNYWYNADGSLPSQQNYAMGQQYGLTAGTTLKGAQFSGQTPTSPPSNNLVTLNALGFYHAHTLITDNYGYSGYADVAGPAFLNSLNTTVGGNGVVYNATTIAQFQAALNALAANNLGLVN